MGACRPVASVQEAILRLGVPATVRLAPGFSLVSDYRQGACRAFDFGRFGRLSLLRGLAARALASRMEATHAEEILCCGLLAQVGRLGLAAAYGEAYGALLAKAPDDASLLALALEQERFALDHRELTDALLEDWGFPAPLRRAIGAHGVPAACALQEGSRELILARALHVADQVARAGVAPDGEKAGLSAAAAAAAAAVGIDADALRGLAQEVAAQSREWAALLELRAPGDPLIELADDEPPGVPGAAIAETAHGGGVRALIVDADEQSGGALARRPAQAG